LLNAAPLSPAVARGDASVVGLRIGIEGSPMKSTEGETPGIRINGLADVMKLKQLAKKAGKEAAKKDGESSEEEEKREN
jgi:hypothetical protein